jgi:hypothetical protein
MKNVSNTLFQTFLDSSAPSIYCHALGGGGLSIHFNIYIQLADGQLCWGSIRKGI